MLAQTVSENKSGISLKLTRLIGAPAERVFNAWLDPALMAKWMGPRDRVKDCKVLMIEPRVGGRYQIQMIGPSCTDSSRGDMIVGGEYREIVPHSRLVFTWTWEHEGQDTLVSLTFKPVGNQTELTLLHENFARAESRDSHRHGWDACLDQLAQFVG